MQKNPDNTRNNRKYGTKTNKLLPTLEEFKRKAKQLKIDNKYEKLGYAQNALAKEYG